MDPTRWYQLDNIGKFYSYQAGDPGQTVFRISAEITNAVDPEKLQAALDEVVRYYPGFNVALRNGIFWHYLEQLTTVPQVSQEAIPICSGFFEGTHRALFRVSYYRNRINLEMSHILSDGRGTIELLKALLTAYFSKHTTHDKPTSDQHPIENPLIDLSDNPMEDSFSANYDKASAKTSKLPKPFHLRGWKNKATPTFFEYHLDSSRVYNLAKSFNVSVTSLIIAAVILACQQTMPTHPKSPIVSLDIPVDLRRFYNSTTLRNFFGLAFVHYDTSKTKPTLASLKTIAQVIQEQLTEATDLQNLKERMNAMVKLEKNPLLRMAPLFLKDLILEAASSKAERDVTTTVSNVGVIKLPSHLINRVQSVSMLTATNGLNFTACTVHDDLCIGISSVFIRHDVVRNFCRIFSELGICGYLNINKDNEEVIESLKIGALEHPTDKSSATTISHKRSNTKQERGEE